MRKSSPPNENVVYLLKKLGDRMNQPDLSVFQKVALKSHYRQLLEEARENHPVQTKKH